MCPFRIAVLPAIVALAGGCETTVRLEAPDRPIEMALDVGVTYDVIIRPPTPTGALTMDRVPDEAAARDRLINQALDHALVEAAGDRSLLFRSDRDAAGIRFSASHEVTLPSATPVRTLTQNLPLDAASAEGRALTAGQCYFRYVQDMGDVARIHQLEDQSVTALAACPIVAADGTLAGAVSLNWDRGQIVDQDRAHNALSDAASAIAPILTDTGL